jgi:hypothetical protein
MASLPRVKASAPHSAEKPRGGMLDLPDDERAYVSHLSVRVCVCVLIV